MRRKRKGAACRFSAKCWPALLLAGFCGGAMWFSFYVNHEIKPTLHELAEYHAQSAAVSAVQQAVAEEMRDHPDFYSGLYSVQGSAVMLDTVRAVRAQTALVAAVEKTMQALPEQDQVIPFGSLTNNSLLSGLGPGWHISLKPQGYVQSQIRQTTRALAINTVQYSAELILTVTINMILDGRTATLTVQSEVPFASMIVTGETPNYYASD